MYQIIPCDLTKEITPCDLTKKLNTTTYVYFVYERRYGHFHVEVTGKMSKKLQGCKKKYKNSVSVKKV